MKKANRFLASGIVGIIATVLSYFLIAILNNILIGINLINIDRTILMLLNIVIVSLSMFISFIVYCKFICKTELPFLKFALFSVAGAFVDIMLRFQIRVAGALLLHRLIDFIVLSVFALIVFSQMAIFQNNESKAKNGKYYPSFWFIVIIEYIISTAASVCIMGFINEWDYQPEAIFSLIAVNMLLSVFYTYLYFLPYLIANKKKHLQTRAIYILNIFAGWTFIAWVIALIWACTVPNEKKVIQQTVQTSNADELLKYKNLLDSGIITQEEFDNKKKQLLQ